MPSDPDRSVFLDEVFDLATELLEEGREPDVDALPEFPDAWLDDVRETLRAAREVALGERAGLPALEGYEVLGELGRGGMGTVFLARQERVGGRMVALKLLSASASLAVGARRRFEREVSSLARVRHPGVVEVYDSIVDGEILGYSMEWVEGASLGQTIAAVGEEREAWRDAVAASIGQPDFVASDPSYQVFVARLGLALARALAAVHDAGLLHRDVKPSNVLLRSDAAPVLIDFGLARDPSATRHTRTGGFVGTPSYAPPEQLRGDWDAFDERSDVYALGATLYHALTGRRPYAGNSEHAILTRIESGVVEPLRRLDPRVPRDLAVIVETALAPRPADRYANASAMADDLERLLSLRPIVARPPGLGRRIAQTIGRNRRSVTAAVSGGGLALIVTALLIGYFVWLPRKVDAFVREARLAVLDPSNAELVYIALNAEIRDGAQLDRPDDRAVNRAGERPSLDRALRSYDWALRLSFGRTDPQLRAERDIVELANGSSEVPERLVELVPNIAWVLEICRREGLVPPGALELEDLDSGALRLLGLLGFLVEEIHVCHDAWERLDTIETPDPLIDAAIGQLELRRGRPARALHRLRSAVRTFADVGFLTIDLARAAFDAGDVLMAERQLDRAEEMGHPDPYHEQILLRARIASARGRYQQAEELFRTINSMHRFPSIRIAWGRSLEARGLFREALLCAYTLVEQYPWEVEHHASFLRVYALWFAREGAECFPSVDGPSEQNCEGLRCLLFQVWRSVAFLAGWRGQVFVPDSVGRCQPAPDAWLRTR